MMTSKKLSIVIPAYNEEKTIRRLLEKVSAFFLPEGFSKEVIIINDCSKDKTEDEVKKFIKGRKEYYLINNEKNLGKTQSVKRGLLETTGNWVVIQDADLEYEPEDLSHMLDWALSKNLDVVYGDRFGGDNGLLYLSFFIGNKFVSLVSNLFTFPKIKKWIPDMEVCYKLVKGGVIRKIAPNISAKSSFGLEPEITARLARYLQKGKHLKWGVVPVRYYPRTIEQGKKIRYSDGTKAIIEIIKYNLF